MQSSVTFFFFFLNTGWAGLGWAGQSGSLAFASPTPPPYSNSAAFNTKVTKGQLRSLLLTQYNCSLRLVASFSSAHSAVEFTVFLQHVILFSQSHS